MEPKADLVKSRKQAVIVGSLVLLLIGSASIAQPLAEPSLVKRGMIAALALLLAFRSTTGLRLGPRISELEDELTKANRASAAFFGFAASVLTSTICTFGAALHIAGGPSAALSVLVTGSAAAGLRFAFLEARA